MEKKQLGRNFGKLSCEEMRGLRRQLAADSAESAKDMLKGLKAHAKVTIQKYIDDSMPVKGMGIPTFYAFVKEFSTESDGQLSAQGKRAVEKLTGELKKFDSYNNLSGLAEIPAEVFLKNIEELDRLEQLNPFETTGDGEEKTLKHPSFERVKKVMDSIQITGYTGDDLDQKEQNDFRETMMDAAKTDAYFRLLPCQDQITENIYLKNLEEVFQINLVNLLITDKIVKEYPLSEESKKRLFDDFEQILAVLP